MDWQAARLGPSFFLRPWQSAVIAAVVMAVATLVQAQGGLFVRRRPRGTSQDIKETSCISTRVARELTDLLQPTGIERDATSRVGS
jgi:hypothetical protein